jgi:hypothetical protein
MPLALLVDKITEANECGKLSLAIFVDLKKAFDTLDHNLLISKLEHYGIRGLPLSLIKDYLTNRSQCVSYNGVISTDLPIITGVPQGSILGPLLFILYINDIVNVSTLFQIFLFADDTTLLKSDKDLPQLIGYVNKELVKLNTWFYVNKLSINIDKLNMSYLVVLGAIQLKMS